MRILLALALVLVAAPCLAALNAATTWEVRTTGATTNGGGWRAGGTGTDWSQFDNKNASGCSSCGSSTVDLSVTDGVTNGTTTVTSATANFGTSIVNNVVYISGGTGSIVADRYEVTARASSTSITVDRSTGLTAGTGVTINIGGAIATLSEVEPDAIAGNTIYVKSGTYSELLTLTIGGGNGVARDWIGYSAARGDSPLDNGRPLIDAAGARANCIAAAATNGNRFFYFRGSGATAANFDLTGGTALYWGCKSSNAAAEGWRVTNGNLMLLCSESSGNATNGMTMTSTGSAAIAGNYMHDNTGSGLSLSTGAAGGQVVLVNNLIEANAATGLVIGAPTHGVIVGNTIDGNTGATSDGIQAAITAPTTRLGTMLGNLLTNNGRYGFNRTATTTYLAVVDYNGTFANATAAYQNVTTGTHEQTADPGFVDAANGNFAIGAALKGLGWPATFPGGTSVSYTDIGAVQRQEAGVSRARVANAGGGR